MLLAPDPLKLYLAVVKSFTSVQFVPFHDSVAAVCPPGVYPPSVPCVGVTGGVLPLPIELLKSVLRPPPP